MNSQIRAAILLLAGFLTLAAAAVHALLSWPHVREDLVEISVRPTLIEAVSTGWSFGSFAMFAFGVIVLWAGLECLRGSRIWAAPLWIIAAAFLLFGTT